MTTQIEAIESLLAEYDMINSSFAKDLREALAEQPAQRPTNCRHCGGAHNVICAGQCKEQPRAEGTLAQQSAERGEPVAWGWAIMHSDGTTAYIRARVEDFFGAIQERESFTEEDVKQADREWAGLVPHSIATLYTAHGITSGEATKKGN